MRRFGRGRRKTPAAYILIALCLGILGALCLPQGLMIGILALTVVLVCLLCCL